MSAPNTPASLPRSRNDSTASVASEDLSWSLSTPLAVTPTAMSPAISVLTPTQELQAIRQEMQAIASLLERTIEALWMVSASGSSDDEDDLRPSERYLDGAPR